MIFKKCSINGKMYLQQGRGLQEVDRNYSLKIGECSVSRSLANISASLPSTFLNLQKYVYNFFEALAICHTVQVAGSYEEAADREEEEQTLLNVNAPIPSIFHKSLDELNDVESVQEEIDFIATRQTIIYDRNGNHANGNGALNHDDRPFSESIATTRFHDVRNLKRPSSLSNIQVLRASTSGSQFSPELQLKNPEVSKENLLLRRLQQQEFKRTISQEVGGTTPTQRDSMTHRRTKSSIPFGTGESTDSV